MIISAERAEQNQESRVRHLADRHGYRIRKSRRQLSHDNQGDFMLIECNRNLLIMGERFDATLAEIEEWLRA